MIVERKGGCDCPNGNFTCEVLGCVRGIRSRADLERDSEAAKSEREAEESRAERIRRSRLMQPKAELLRKGGQGIPARCDLDAGRNRLRRPKSGRDARNPPPRQAGGGEYKAMTSTPEISGDVGEIEARIGPEWLMEGVPNVIRYTGTIKQMDDDVIFLLSRVRELEGALKPFAEALKGNYSHQKDHLPIHAGANEYDLRFSFTLGDLRKAASVLTSRSRSNTP